MRTQSRSTRTWAGSCAIAIGSMLTGADVHASEPPVFGVDSYSRVGNPISTSVPAAPKPEKEAAPTSSSQTRKRWNHDERFVQRVQGLVAMASGLQQVCPIGATPVTKIDEIAIEKAIVAYVKTEIDRTRAEIQQIEAARKTEERKEKKDELSKEKAQLERDLDQWQKAITKDGNGLYPPQDKAGNYLSMDKAGHYPPKPADGSDSWHKAAQKQLSGIQLASPCALCSEGPSVNDAQKPVSVCGFADQAMATAAVISDPQSVEALARFLMKQSNDSVGKLNGFKVRIGSLGISLADLPTVEISSAIPLLAAVKGAEEILERKKAAGTVDIAALSLRTMDVALAALARVIEDRAKREGLVWFLERMHENVCKDGPTNKQKTTAEIKKYWLKNMCSLAERRSEFMQYGGGAELLRAFQGAIASDVKMWPGAAAGLSTATLYLKGLNLTPQLTSPLDCHGQERQEATTCSTEELVCHSLTALRQSTAKMTGDLLAGVNVGVALDEYAAAINALNRNQSTFFNAKFQAAACAASIPLGFQQYEAEVDEIGLNRFDATKALLLGALTRSPACFAITGKGWSTTECKVFDVKNGQSTTVCDQTAKLYSEIETHPGRIERLTTILRWADELDTPARTIAGRWSVLRDTTKIFANAFEQMQKDVHEPPPTPPKFDVGAVNDAKTFKEAIAAVQAYTESTSRIFQQSKHVKFLQSSAALAHAGVDFGVAVMAAGKTITSSNLLPGLCPQGRCPDSFNGFGEGLEVLVKLSNQLDTIEGALVGDWGNVVPRVIAEIRADVGAACNNDAGCVALASHLSRYAGVFTALATNPDPEATARTLDAAAMPIGGWRRKLVPGATTVSIAAFPGFAMALEGRWGQYGATYERLSDLHFASPTLTLPVGIDMSWGGKCSHVFFSLLDPAAYLQYDGENQDRLPGAQLITALAPGVSWRITPFDAPLSINPFLMLRPNLRAWESGLSSPAAHALQLGLNVSLDVTLFELFARDPNMEAQ